MKFSRLKRESALFWPKEIDISDGEFVGENGARFPTMIAIKDRVEEHQGTINEWHSIMSWSVFVGYHTAAKEKLKNGDLSKVRFSDIDWSVVERHFSGTLFGPNNWPRVMRSQYVNDQKS
jgi:hypothetical protein